MLPAQPTRASVEQVYAQIVADLTAGAPCCPSKENGYVNYYAIGHSGSCIPVHGKLGCLLAAAEEIINSSIYTYTPENWVNSRTVQFNTESIFELYIVTGESDLTSGP